MDKQLRDIEEKIRLAVDVDRVLPPVFKVNYRSPLGGMIKPDPDVVQERNFYDGVKMNYGDEEIKIWEKVCFDWLPKLPKATQMIIWWRCSDMGWKRLSRNLKEKGYVSQELHRVTLFRYFVKGLEKIKKNQNG